MRRILQHTALIGLALIGCGSIPVASSAPGDVWSVEFHRGLNDRQKGDLVVTLYGTRVFSHAFIEPRAQVFPRRISGGATVEAIIQVTQSPDAAWGSNPMGEAIPDSPPTIGLIWCRDWTTGYGRWYSRTRHELRPGTFRIVVPIDPWAWSSVFGKVGNATPRIRDHWHDAMTDTGRFGVCAGGYFYGHGVEAKTGSTMIRIVSLKVRK